MTSTNFVNTVTLTDADWFNDVDRVVYDILDDPADAAAVRVALGLDKLNAYEWNETVAPLGQHTFSLLQGDPSSTFRIFGGNFATAAGTTLATYYNAVPIADIDVSLIDGTPSAETSRMRFGIATAGVFDQNAMTLQKNPSYSRSQLQILSGGPGLTNKPEEQALLVWDTVGAGFVGGIGIITAGAGGHTIQSNSGIFYCGVVGSTAPASWVFLCDSAGVMTATSFSAASDRSFKQNVRPITNALNDLLRIPGVRYYNASSQREEIGVVAQDVAPVFPELVGSVEKGKTSEDEPAQTLATVNYGSLIAPIIEALREIDARLKRLEHA